MLRSTDCNTWATFGEIIYYGRIYDNTIYTSNDGGSTIINVARDGFNFIKYDLGHDGITGFINAFPAGGYMNIAYDRFSQSDGLIRKVTLYNKVG